MKASSYMKGIGAGIALTVGLANAASAASFIPDAYTAPGGFSGVFSSAGGDNGTFVFDIATAGDYLIELTPSPLASADAWSATVVGFGALTHATSKLLGVFTLPAGNDYQLFIESPDVASAQGYSMSGVMASASEVPLPGTLGLLGVGLFGIGAMRRKVAAFKPT